MKGQASPLGFAVDHPRPPSKIYSLFSEPPSSDSCPPAQPPMRSIRPVYALKKMSRWTERLKVISSASLPMHGMSFEHLGPARPGFENRSSPRWCCGRPLVRSAIGYGIEEEAARPFPSTAISVPRPARTRNTHLRKQHPCLTNLNAVAIATATAIAVHAQTAPAPTVRHRLPACRSS